ncbi:hypothetical protein COOFOMLJ_01597 [Aeromonas veronii]
MSRSTSTTKNQDVYNSGTWRRIRNAYMKNHVLCEHCQILGIITPAKICDHIIEIEDDYNKRFDSKNLQALCQACHNKKTAQQAKLRASTNVLTPSQIMQWAKKH